MNDLEQSIKALERKLALKNAYLAAQVSFPKGSKFPEDVKEEIIEIFNSFKTAKASDQEVQNSTNSIFSDEDITVLKMLISSVTSKTSVNAVSERSIGNSVAPQKTPSALPPVSREPSRQVQQEAKLLTLESVPAQFRNKIPSESKVFVMSIKDDRARISTEDGYSFQVLVEDLEFVDKPLGKPYT